MQYMGLDLSLTNSGFCIIEDSMVLATGTSGSKTIHGSKRLDLIVHGLRMFIGGRDIGLAAIEGYSYGSAGNTFQIGELGGVIRWKLDLWQIPYIVVTPTSLKTFITGSGGADKVQMGTVIRDVHGRDFLRRDWQGSAKGKPMPDDWGSKDSHWRSDEADAYALACVAALYSDDWDRTPTPVQLGIIEAIRLDPRGELTKAAKARKLKGGK